MLCLAENEIRAFKTEGKKNVKITVTSQSLPSYIIISRIYLCSPSSPLQRSAKHRKLHKKKIVGIDISSYILHRVAIFFSDCFSYESVLQVS